MDIIAVQYRLKSIEEHAKMIKPETDKGIPMSASMEMLIEWIEELRRMVNNEEKF